MRSRSSDLPQVGAPERKLLRYPGLKEDYYLADFEPDPSVLEELGIDRDAVLVVVRPPPETSEYHEENPLHERVLDRLAEESGVQTVVIPRTAGRPRPSSNEQRATSDLSRADSIVPEPSRSTLKA